MGWPEFKSTAEVNGSTVTASVNVSSTLLDVVILETMITTY